ncbi:MAG: DUF1566 domain-containing protein [Betaproteobacteria bacterium]|nr:DUF1566 domain-containing protein [Betaproteobacteria bacterium]
MNRLIPQATGGAALALSLFLAPAPGLIPSAHAALNDTGHTSCFDDSAAQSCSSIAIDAGTFPRQDARFGRDAAAAAGSLVKAGRGAAGFDFSKVCNSGEVAGTGTCPADASLTAAGTGPDDWGCTKDNVTGLLWSLYDEGTMQWGDWASNLSDANAGTGRCGKTDWRVPMPNELFSIAHFGTATGVTLDTDFFPYPPFSGLFWRWTNTEDPIILGNAFAFFDRSGTFTSQVETSAFHLSLVSGAPMSPNFSVDSVNGLATDSTTNLMWDQCVWGTSNSTCSTGTPWTGSWQDALQIAVTANASNYKGHSDWRLPNVKELLSIVDYSSAAPAISSVAFPGGAHYPWSSSTNHLGSEAYAFVLSGLGFYFDSVSKTTNAYNALLVRGGDDYDALATTPAAAPTLTGPTISNPGDHGADFSVQSDQGVNAWWGVFTGTLASCPGMGDPGYTAGPTFIMPGASLSDTLGSLDPGTDYTFCFIANNANGTSIGRATFRTTGGSGSGGTPTPAPTPTPTPIPAPSPGFSDGDTLSPGGDYSAPSGNSSFCLGDSGSAPVTVRIDNVPYTISPLAENTCFEIFSTGSGRALILDSGSADISSIVPGSNLLEARNGDLVTGNGKIRATVDPVCTSTRVMILEGDVKAPEWITSPMPASGCPEDALTPPKSRFMVSDGKLGCPPSALAIKGTWAKLTVKHTQNLSAGQQVFDVAAYAPAGWFQNGPQGWAALGDTFLPVDTATESGQRTTTLVNGLDVRGILGTELYTGHGANAEEMMGNGRYCGVLKVAP